MFACLDAPPVQGLPMDGESSTVWLYRAVILTFALLTAWPGPCCNNPAFAEIVPAAQRNIVYSFDRCFEGEALTSSLHSPPGPMLGHGLPAAA
jgi:hypothetical protein